MMEVPTSSPGTSRNNFTENFTPSSRSGEVKERITKKTQLTADVIAVPIQRQRRTNNI